MASTRMRRRRLVLWSLLAVAFLFLNFHRTATGVLADTLARTFDATGSELGFLHASFFYIYAGLQLPAGLIVDRYGPRRVVTAGLAVMTLGVVWFVTTETLTAALVARGVIGLGGSVFYIATLRFCASWYRPDEYATMTGVTIAAAGIGGVLATTPLALALNAVGWQVALLATGAVTGVLAVAVAGFVRDTPERAGYEGVGAAEENTADLGQVLSNTRTVIRQPETWLLGALLFFTLGTNFTVLGLWGVPFIVDTYEVSVAQASLYVLLGNVGFVLGSPAFGALSDRLGRRTGLIILGTLLFTVAYATLLVVPPLPIVGLVLFLALFANGAVALCFTVAKERHAPEVGGTVTGVINSLGYFGAAVLPALMGVVLDTYWTGEVINGARVYTVTGYRVAFGIAAFAGVLALGCALWLHGRETGVTVRSVLSPAD